MHQDATPTIKLPRARRIMELYVKRELKYEGGSRKTAKKNRLRGRCNCDDKNNQIIRVVTNDKAILAVRTNIVIASATITGVRLSTF